MTFSRLAALAVFTATAMLLAFYGAYFMRVLTPLPTEISALALTAQGAPTAYSTILQAWATLAGEGLGPARALSLLAGMGALVLLARIVRRLSGDDAAAAWATLGFVLFPPLVAVLASATPHALIILLCLAALDVMLSAAQRPARVGAAFAVLAGLCAGLAVLLFPLGGVLLPLWLALCGVLSRDARAFAVSLLPVVIVAALMRAFGLPVADIDLDLAAAGHGSVLTALLLPYSMVPVVMLLGALAMCARAVRDNLGLARGVAVLAAPGIAAGVLLTSALSIGQLLTGFASAAPFFLLSAWPLITWVRIVMPGVKSLLAWIVFPVVMYSCFWVVLGPINPDRFPYSHRQIAQPNLLPPR